MAKTAEKSAITRVPRGSAFQRTSPQKAKLVLDLIKGLRVEKALNTVHFSTKRMAPVVEKVLRSAVQNASYVSARSRVSMSMSTTSTSAPRSRTKARA